MSDLIDRQDALDAIQKRADEIDSVNSAFWEGLKIAQDIVEKVPSAEPERTAKVVHSEKFGDWKNMCGNCFDEGKKMGLFPEQKYCYECGARLEWE